MSRYHEGSGMTVHTLFLIPALLLLWMPRSWLYWGEKPRQPKRRGAWGRFLSRLRKPPPNYDRTTRVVRFWAELLKRRNFLDLLRASAGAWAVTDFAVTFASTDAEALASDPMLTTITTAKSLVLLLAVLIQTLRRHEERIVFVAPIYFVTGISLGVVGFTPGALAWALLWALSPLLFGPERLMIVYTLLLGVFGPLFGGWDNVIAWMPAAAALLPVVVSMIGKQPLRISVQRIVPSTTGLK